MKIVRFDSGRIGISDGSKVVDVTPEGGQSWPPVEILRFVRDFDLDAAGKIFASSPGQPLSEVRLQAPIIWPNKLLAFPVNYTEHGKEMNSVNRADRNGFFLKTSSCIIGPNDKIVIPDIPG